MRSWNSVPQFFFARCVSVPAFLRPKLLTRVVFWLYQAANHTKISATQHCSGQSRQIAPVQHYRRVLHNRSRGQRNTAEPRGAGPTKHGANRSQNTQNGDAGPKSNSTSLFRIEYLKYVLPISSVGFSTKIRPA